MPTIHSMLRAMQHAPLVRHGLVVPRLYVSRSRLPGHLGGLLFEDLLEENLIAEGYAIMYPEQLPIAEQVAVYASARQFIFAEGSSLHLGVGFIGADCPVAVVCRRPPRNPRPGYLLAAGLHLFRSENLHVENVFFIIEIKNCRPAA